MSAVTPAGIQVMGRIGQFCGRFGILHAKVSPVTLRSEQNILDMMTGVLRRARLAR